MGSKSLNKGLTWGENITYSLGSLGREVSNNCINVFFLAYLNVYMGLNALALTAAFVVAKLWDTINDPLLATLVNNTKPSKRWGKFRPWIAIGALLNAVTLVAMFIPLESSPDGVKYFYYIFMYIIWGMTFTMVDVPFWSMLPTIANSTEERNKLSSLSKLVGGFGGFVASTIGTSLCMPLLSPKIGTTKAYLCLGAIVAVLMFCFIMVTVLCNKEKYKIPSEDAGIKEIFNFFKSNDQLRSYAVSYVLFCSATTISLFQILYIFIYYGNDAMGILNPNLGYTVFTIVACTGQGIAMFFYNLITKKIPREKIYGGNYFMAMIGMAALFLVFFILKPTYGSLSNEASRWINVVIVAIAGAFLMTSNGLNQIGSTVMIADVVDYGEYLTGKRGDSIIFSVQTLLTKFAGAIAMLLLGIGIEVANLPQIVSKWNQAAKDGAGEFQQVADLSTGVLDSKALTILRVFMFLIPIPICAIGYIVYKKKYNLYGTRYDEIKAEIERRRAVAEGVLPEGSEAPVAECVVADVAAEGAADVAEASAEAVVEDVVSAEAVAAAETPVEEVAKEEEASAEPAAEDAAADSEEPSVKEEIPASEEQANAAPAEEKTQEEKKPAAKKAGSTAKKAGTAKKSGTAKKTSTAKKD